MKYIKFIFIPLFYTKEILSVKVHIHYKKHKSIKNHAID
jgi:hypothetical protein